MNTESEVKKFWDDRARNTQHPGSDDYILKEIEARELMSEIEENSEVLDFGCGNGETLIKIYTEKKCHAHGYDFSDGMVEVAKSNIQKENLSEFISVEQASLLDEKKTEKKFDVVYTERSLINLASFEEQAQALKNLSYYLKPNGKIINIESSRQGLARTNELRKILDLDEIKEPWHNHFIDEKRWEKLEIPGLALERVSNITSTYSLLSRVVYAKVAYGEQLKYDSDINKLALKLPNLGNIGPVRMWVWRKA
jgi:ubiquinone/menaquinone biosynthesis C-methylase UbiE